MLLYLQPYKWAGAATVILRHVFSAVRLYIMLSVLLILGFGLSFRVLFQPRFVPRSLDVDEDYSSFPRSIQSTYFGLFGVFEPDVSGSASMLLRPIVLFVAVPSDRSQFHRHVESIPPLCLSLSGWNGASGTVDRHIGGLV